MTAKQWEHLRKLIIIYGEAKVNFETIDTKADPNYRSALEALDKSETLIEDYMKQFIKD